MVGLGARSREEAGAMTEPANQITTPAQAPPPTRPFVQQSELMHSQEIDKIAGALAKAQGEVVPAKKSGMNPHFGKPYSTLSDCWDSARVPLSKNELAVTQLTNSTPDGKVSIFTMLVHSSGQWFRSRLLLIPSRNDPQGIGSALTYGRRYGFNAIVGVSNEDDDGEAALGRTEGAPQNPRPAAGAKGQKPSSKGPKPKSSSQPPKSSAKVTPRAATASPSPAEPEPSSVSDAGDASEDDVPQDWDQTPDALGGPGGVPVLTREQMNQSLMPLWKVFQRNHKDIPPLMVLQERYAAQSVSVLTDDQLADLIGYFENDNAANSRKGKRQ